MFYLGLHLAGCGPPTVGKGRQSVLFSLLIQMFIWSRNTFTNAPRITFDQISGQPVAQMR